MEIHGSHGAHAQSHPYPHWQATPSFYRQSISAAEHASSVAAAMYPAWGPLHISVGIFVSLLFFQSILLGTNSHETSAGHSYN